MSRKKRHPLHGMALYSAILAQLAGSVLVGIFLGRWLDEKIGLEPLFLIVCLLAGLAIGVFGVILTIRQSGD
ncbi:membrane protein [Siminovitchia terrae]|uniref:AtpZ/AtpI family protein n=1 Tax=Siminovitchia terrae TaxID=1914933 RepID=A0A429XC06_SIMTE|nr:AtpZ/AtpI family protein [Siminovitchia terrae]RST60986.1 AtpZ/AtpI family protein [Siminovitchia terrae]GIN90847.1 membrane protein [Siminovitchia terrae]GIN97622.1 membrane protein [Siminovitchia terrae]